MDWQGLKQQQAKASKGNSIPHLSNQNPRVASIPRILVLSCICFLALMLEGNVRGADLQIKGIERGKDLFPDKKTPTVMRSCFCPQVLSPSESPLHLEREHPWSLPKRSLANQQAGVPDTVRVLCLRVSFPLESPDDPRTSGRGKMDFRDTLAFEAEFGHTIDPTPHDSLYFDTHMSALDNYYSFVSRGKLTILWDVFPPGDTMTYIAPRPMAYYGNPDSVESRLTEFFVDCIKLADSVSPEIVFSNYQSTILFHAGSDRQNDIGFPPTEHDLFTGFIKSGIGVLVDVNDPEPETTITTTMFVPEQGSQDGRSTALNAVMAHEFGHQLGLVDLYSTRNLFTQLGDFALMDNNGFGVGIDFGFQRVFRTFGAIPVYMSAWSRAFLGFDEVVELPPGTPLAVAAAALDTANATRIVKVPISKFEYFLIENRQQQVKLTGLVSAKIDSVTSVILGPARRESQVAGSPIVLSGEYDFLLPGDGLIIYHVDESVAFGDADGDGLPNFQDNDLQWEASQRFVSIVEADGFVDLGGNFFKGTGNANDYWNPSTFNSLTPNTNPSTHSRTGANTHISISIDSSSDRNHTISVSGGNSTLVDSFPIWVGINVNDLNPLSYDIDTTMPGEEIITAVGDKILITDGNGAPGWEFSSPLVKSFINFTDTVRFFIGGDTTAPALDEIFPINLFAKLPGLITCDPIVGAMDDTAFVAVAVGDTVYAYSFFDSDPFDGPNPDFLWKFVCDDTVRQLLYNSADSALYALTGLSLCRFDNLSDMAGTATALTLDPQGVCSIDDAVVVLTTAGSASRLYFIRGATKVMYNSGGTKSFGPIATDLDRDGMPEVIVSSAKTSSMLAVTIDTSTTTPSFLPFADQPLFNEITAPPILTDLDKDGFPDIVVLSDGKLEVLNHELVNLTGFPQEIDRDFPQSVARAPSLAYDVDGDNDIDVVFGAQVNDSLSGNVYALGIDEPFGFPLPAGGALRGAPVIASDLLGSSLSYVGSDGFMYRWKINNDTSGGIWRMAGFDAARSFYFPAAKLTAPVSQSGGIAENSVFCYPNPARGAQATLRYTLDRDAQSVAINIYDMTGELVGSYDGSGFGGLANEVAIDCRRLAPGVYRVRIEALFQSGTEKTFTDLAVVH